MTKLKFILSILSFFYFSSAHAMNIMVPEDSNSNSYFLSSWLPNITFYFAGLMTTEILSRGKGPIWTGIISCCKKCKPPQEPADDELLEGLPNYGSMSRSLDIPHRTSDEDS